MLLWPSCYGEQILIGFFQIYFLIVLVMSLICFVIYGYDKRQAKNNGWRIPERTLHTLALLGGWPGALLGQQYFRHKTQKLQFRLTTYLMIVVHVVLIGIVVYYK